MKKNFNIYEPIIWPIFTRLELEKKYIYRQHKFKLSVWINHKEILNTYFKHAKKLRSYLSSKGLNTLYNNGGCMIYLYLDEIEIYYPDFLEGKYTLPD